MLVWATVSKNEQYYWKYIRVVSTNEIRDNRKQMSERACDESNSEQERVFMMSRLFNNEFIKSQQTEII